MLNLKKRKKDVLQVDENGVTIIPKDYLWCEGCKALTMHTKGDYHWEHICVVCGESSSYTGCPNCGAPEPDEDGGPLMYEVTLHHPGCHCDDTPEDHPNHHWLSGSHAEQVAYEFKRDWMNGYPEPRWSEGRDQYHEKRKARWKRGQIWQEAYQVKCGCPTTTVYPTPQIFNYQSWPEHGMDCMNHVEWAYCVRCPICGYIYEVHDGNC